MDSPVSGDFFSLVRVWVRGWLVVIKCGYAKFVGKSICCVETSIYSELRSI